MNTQHPAIEVNGRFNCQDCSTRGNVCMDSDRVYRCSLCSYAAWNARRHLPIGDPMDDPNIRAAFDSYVDERGSAA